MAEVTVRESSEAVQPYIINLDCPLPRFANSRRDICSALPESKNITRTVIKSGCPDIFNVDLLRHLKFPIKDTFVVVPVVRNHIA